MVAAAAVAVPGGGGAGIDVIAEGVAAREVMANSLQLCDILNDVIERGGAGVAGDVSQAARRIPKVGSALVRGVGPDCLIEPGGQGRLQCGQGMDGSAARTVCLSGGFLHPIAVRHCRSIVVTHQSADADARAACDETRGIAVLQQRVAHDAYQAAYIIGTHDAARSVSIQDDTSIVVSH